jgi:hypothetical protein
MPNWWEWLWRPRMRALGFSDAALGILEEQDPEARGRSETFFDVCTPLE